MPPLESRFKTVAICLDATCLGEPAKLKMTTTTTVSVFAIVAMFSRGSREYEPPSTCPERAGVCDETTFQIVPERPELVHAHMSRPQAVEVQVQRSAVLACKVDARQGRGAA